MRTDSSKATNTMTEENDSMSCHYKTSDRGSDRAGGEDSANGGNTVQSHFMQLMRCSMEYRDAASGRGPLVLPPKTGPGLMRGFRSTRQVRAWAISRLTS
jgi:hypothetical protein